MEISPVSPLEWPPQSGAWVRPRGRRRTRLMVAALVGLAIGYLAGWAFAGRGAGLSPAAERAFYDVDACEETLEWSERDRQELADALEEVYSVRHRAIVRTAQVIAEHRWLCSPGALKVPVVKTPPVLAESGTAL